MRAIIGNKKAVTYLSDSLTSDTLSHAYLFSGPASVGKTTVALDVAKKILCLDGGEDDCACHSCHSVHNLTHPDLHYLSCVGAGVDEVRDIIGKLQMKPYQSKYRVAIITHVDSLTVQGLNSFLKTLEEPSENTVLILTTENKAVLLDTIVSRSRQVTFGTVSDKEIFEHLNQELGVKKERARELSLLSAGRVGIAISLSDESNDLSQKLESAETFLRTFRSDSIFDKLNLASKLVSDKDNLKEQIPIMSVLVRRLMLNAAVAGKNDDAIAMVSALDALAKGDGLLRRNINPKLVFESMLLRSI